MAITFVGLKSPLQLDAVVNQCCPGNKMWKLIVESEREMHEYSNTMGDAESENIAYEIMDGTKVLGLIQYNHSKGGFLKKEKIVINLLTLVEYDPELIGEIHRALIQKHGLSGELIHVIAEAEENTPIHHRLKELGFSEERNNYRHPKYGFEGGTLYFVKKVSA